MNADLPTPPSLPLTGRPWYRELTRYHWFVFAIACLGWLFDTMDQQLFNLARNPAIAELLGAKPGDPRIVEYGGFATAIFIMGWGIGGLLFGVLGDRLGRVKTMVLTILLYSLFTGLSALSRSVWDFAIYRFLTGLGVGGEFAVGVALVAEVMPDHVRPHALAWLQASSTIGNVTAAISSIVLGSMEASGAIGSGWRAMFLIGVLPALLVLPIMARLDEPERWKKLKAADGGAKQLGSLKELFGDPRWRRNAIVGMLLGFAGVVGLWGIGFFSFDLIRPIFYKSLKAQGLAEEVIKGRLTLWVGIASVVQNLGGFVGIYVFSRLTQKIGRKPAFAIAFLLAPLSTAYTFWFLEDFSDIFWMLPIMGACQLMLFGGYAIYFPELFPTRLRSTGTSLCYNVGRFAAAIGPLILGQLTSKVFVGFPREPMRYAGVTMCAIFFLGLVALPFAPETKGKPLPE